MDCIDKCAYIAAGDFAVASCDGSAGASWTLYNARYPLPLEVQLAVARKRAEVW